MNFATASCFSISFVALLWKNANKFYSLAPGFSDWCVTVIHCDSARKILIRSYAWHLL